MFRKLNLDWHSSQINKREIGNTNLASARNVSVQRTSQNAYNASFQRQEEGFDTKDVWATPGNKTDWAFMFELLP
eukprot:11433792-Heterocapsa_arctica.AAC.1